jgi:hypothetical protein
VDMGKDLYTIFSHNKSSLSKLVDEIEKDLINDKIGFKGPSPLPEAHSSSIRRIEDSKSLNNNDHLWLLDANPHRLGYIVSEFDADTVFGYEIQIPGRHTRAVDIISDKVRPATEIYYTKTSSSETTHVPFSYDPNQEFKTEPDR